MLPTKDSLIPSHSTSYLEDGHRTSAEAMEFIPQSEEEMELRRGAWTADEDLVLMNYIALHGEGRWSSLARRAGIDSCLPGRTDNEIKNYWRTRVQKHAKHLHCDVHSKQFEDVLRHLWIPRLVERIQASSGDSPAAAGAEVPTSCDEPVNAIPESAQVKMSPESSSTGGWSSVDSFGLDFLPPPVSNDFAAGMQGGEDGSGANGCWSECGYSELGVPDFDQSIWEDEMWSMEDIWLQQQL
ncbi:hypothetical protein BHM03_00000097 [Ensete ventricosum]|uniref:Uncharacterized protein n=1 Tax=Ensete ventricosum TaxID=4639 RepID=A0A445M8C7_ENSVE|nr:hypothetical protein BHM03_00000097 [Ensete ventricosum]